LNSAPPPNPQSAIPNPQSAIPDPQSLIPNPLYACLYRPPSGDPAAVPVLGTIAGQFSPRYERHRDDLVSIDVSGLERLLGPPRTIADELRREATARGVRAHIAVAGTRMAAMVLALARPGVTVIPRGAEAAALAAVRIEILSTVNSQVSTLNVESSDLSVVDQFKRWGLKTLGELAALPAADLVSRLGRPALAWQAIARGEDIRPLVPTLAEERFEASIELEWPIEDLEPLSFVLTRLLEPLSTRLERRDRGAAVLHVLLGLVTREACARRLELPTPMRDVRTLRTLALLDLESHPPAAAIDRVTIVIDPTPGRVLQHTLFTRAHPTPEQLSTLVARLGALMGQDRFGAPATVDSDRPGAFVMTPFATEHEKSNRGERKERREGFSQTSAVSAVSAVKRNQPPAPSPQPLISALRRCRQPVPARVAVADGRPVRVTTDRRGFAGGTVVKCAGPWRTSGDWWAGDARDRWPMPNTPERHSLSGSAGEGGPLRRPVLNTPERDGARASASGGGAPRESKSWDRDEWDVSLSDGAVYRIFQDRASDAWFVDAIVD
jgi:protein ImuB